MPILLNDLESLVATNNETTRSTIANIGWSSMQALSNEALIEIDRGLRHELLVLAVEAKKICDDFYLWLKQKNSLQREKDRCFLLLRWRLRDNSLTIDWNIQKIVKYPNSARPVIRSERIEPQNKFGYSVRQWGKFPAWVVPRVKSVEEELTRIRERAALLGDVRASLRLYKDSVVRSRNIKKKELDLPALPVPTITPRRDGKA